MYGTYLLYSMVRYTKTKIYLHVEPVFRIGIILISVADLDPGSGAFLTPRSGMNILDLIFEN
jgi:hypothetical protein